MAIEIVVRDIESSPFILTEQDEVIIIQPGTDIQLSGKVNLRGPQGEAAFKGVQAFIGGLPNPSETLVANFAPYDITFTAANCKAGSINPATAETVFDIKADNVTIGTITFAIGATVGNVVFSQAVVAKDAFISIIAPAIQDATLSDLSFLLV